MFIDIDDLKTKLKITDATHDAMLNIAINEAEILVLSLTGDLN